MEVTSQQISRIIEIIGSILLVALGAAISPWISARIETRKNKKSIKPNLIKEIYTIYSLTKIRLEISNHNEYNRLKVNAINVRIATSSLGESEKSELQINRDDFNNLLTIGYEDQNNVVYKCLETESNIRALVAQTDQYYNTDKYESLRFQIDFALGKLSVRKEWFTKENFNTSLPQVIEKELSENKNKYHFENDLERTSIIMHVNKLL